MKKKFKREVLGNKSSGVSHYIIAFIIDALIHLCVFLLYDFKYYDIPHFIISFIFFAYPVCFVFDVLWSMRPSVYKLLNGEHRVNRKYYMNEVREGIEKSKYYDITISIPVYLEENSVIFQTITDSIAAKQEYEKISGKDVNIIVSDDGIGAVLQDQMYKERIDQLIDQSNNDPESLSEEINQVIKRISFYRENNISFVARPKENREGLFKKASNLNYTLLLGDAIENNHDLHNLLRESGRFEGGYVEGNIITNDIIMLLDKDSGVNPNIIDAIMPEFVVDKKLAYVQCSTNAKNPNDNFFAGVLARHVNNLFHNIWPCNALKGFFTPLVGHNVFVRKSALKEIGYWDITKVSEDYDAAIRLYSNGYHGKYAQIPGLEFTEYASRTYTEEAAKQYRYTYGLFEMIFEGTINFKKARKRDIFYMIIYFLSKIYIVTTIPYALFVAYVGDINIMWAGFILSQLIFMFLPAFRRIVLRKHIKNEYMFNIRQAIVLSVSYLGYSYSSLMGALKFLANKIKSVKSFPASAVGDMNYCFTEGVIIMNDYIANNISFIIVAGLCVDRIVSVATRHYSLILTKLTCTYILLGIILVPFLLTPHFYHVNFKKKKVFKHINLLPIIALFVIVIFISSVSYRYYTNMDYGEQALSRTNSMSLLNPANDFSYKFLDIEPGQTKKIHFEVKNSDKNRVLRATTKYSLIVSKNKLPFTYKLKCNASKGKCISEENLKANKYYTEGLMPKDEDTKHNYTLYVSWESSKSKNKFLRIISNYVELIKYNLLPNKRFNIRLLSNNYVYNVSLDSKKYNKNSNEDITMKVDAQKSLFNAVNVYINDKLISNDNYSIDGNNIILNKEYLNNLDEGKYKIKIVLSNNGEALTNFTITNK